MATRVAAGSGTRTTVVPLARWCVRIRSPRSIARADDARGETLAEELAHFRGVGHRQFAEVVRADVRGRAAVNRLLLLCVRCERDRRAEDDFVGDELREDGAAESGHVFAGEGDFVGRAEDEVE